MTARPLVPQLIDESRRALAYSAVAFVVCTIAGAVAQDHFFDDALLGLAIGLAAALVVAVLLGFWRRGAARKLPGARRLPLHVPRAERPQRTPARMVLEGGALTALFLVGVLVLDFPFSSLATILLLAALTGVDNGRQARIVQRAEREEGRRYWRVAGGGIVASEEICWTPVDDA